MTASMTNCQELAGTIGVVGLVGDVARKAPGPIQRRRHGDVGAGCLAPAAACAGGRTRRLGRGSPSCAGRAIRVAPRTISPKNS
jgi:hypothetical protein